MPDPGRLRQSMNWLRLCLALALWPGVWATGVCFAGLLRSAATHPSFPWWAAGCFAGGWILSGLAYLFLPRPRGIYVLGHELSHALAVWFSGGRVHSLQVAEKGGRVVSDRTSAWITLAPYILPLYPLFGRHPFGWHPCRSGRGCLTIKWPSSVSGEASGATTMPLPSIFSAPANPIFLSTVGSSL